MSNDRPLHVLVVDDSAVVRQTMTAILGNEGFQVTTAADPIHAMARLEDIRPDVMLLDLEMPRMDGLSFLRQIMNDRPMPVIICSAFAARGTTQAMQALEDGAVEVVAKPEHGVRDFLYESSVTLSDTVRAAAAARLPQRHAPRPSPPPGIASRRNAGAADPSPFVVAIGASTGGTDALRTILKDLGPETPAIVIAQHMPARFTTAFARSLSASSRIDVREAVSGEVLTMGTALIAPGDRHMLVTRSGARFVVRVADGPLVSRHRPSVDLLFRSVASAARRSAMGMLLTGMGADGASGLLEMKRAGAVTVAQDEASCIVFGMPKEAIRIGATTNVLPLSEMALAIRSAQARATKREELQRSEA